MIGEAISYYRRVKGLKQKELASCVGVTPQTVSVWEKGITEPTPDKYPAILHALGVSIRDVLDYDPKRQKKEPAPEEEQTPEIKRIKLGIMRLSDVDAAIRLRKAAPKIIAMLADPQFTDEDIREFAMILHNRQNRNSNSNEGRVNP